MKKQFHILNSIGFIGGLMVLLVNDHFLKAEFHNVLTGKLSDLAGLFIFPLFLVAFFPRYKKHIYWITAVGFIWWKSPLSNTFIEWWSHSLFSIERVIDRTDLFALIILPLSYGYINLSKHVHFHLHPLPIILICSMAFIATSRSMEKVNLYKAYWFNLPLDTLQKRIYLKERKYAHESKDWDRRDSLEKADPRYQHPDSLKVKDEIVDRYVNPNDSITYYIHADVCMNGFQAAIVLTGDENSSEIILIGLEHHCHKDKNTIQYQLIRIFEEQFIQPLK